MRGKILFRIKRYKIIRLQHTNVYNLKKSRKLNRGTNILNSTGGTRMELKNSPQMRCSLIIKRGMQKNNRET